ncbi:MAG: helix-turn-helix domain-containing protein [Planctomycetales bacterium]
MKRKRKQLVSDQIREAIQSSGLTVYRMAQLAEIEKSTLSRFLSGERGLSMSALDRLGGLLDLEIVMHGPKES